MEDFITINGVKYQKVTYEGCYKVSMEADVWCSLCGVKMCLGGTYMIHHFNERREAIYFHVCGECRRKDLDCDCHTTILR